jgi:Uma2 family endonuclease
MAQPALVPESVPRPESDSIILLHGATWADYQRVLELRGDKSVPRVAYLEGVLELMSPALSHEVIKSMLGRLVEAWCLEKGVDITPYGSWTHESKETSRGAEPDECYVLGDDSEPARCDLAIEVVWTHGGVDKLDIYRRLGVGEVWIWKSNRLSLHRLRGDRYEAVSASEVLPGIDLQQLLEFLQIRPMTRAVREYRAAFSGDALG